jgi:hypothetical protein
MLGSEDLLQLPTKSFFENDRQQQTEYERQPFDYDTVRAEIEETRALKSNADFLISKYIKASERVRSDMTKAKRKQQEQERTQGISSSSRLRSSSTSRQKKHINSGITGGRYYDGGGNNDSNNQRSTKTNLLSHCSGRTGDITSVARRNTGVVMAKTKRTQQRKLNRRKKTPSSTTTKLRKKAAINSSRGSGAANPNAKSPGAADRIFVSKRSSIRPSELDDIRTYPKKEVEIIRRSRKTKPKVGPTEIYDKRSKVKEARFVHDNVARNADESRGLLRDSEALLGLSSVSQKLTILADTRDLQEQQQQRNDNIVDEDGPSPRFLRPQPTAKSFSPEVQKHQHYKPSLNPAATILNVPKATTQSSLPHQQTVPPQIIYQQVQQPAIDPEFVRVTNEKLAQAEEMVRKLNSQTALLETTNAALKSQLLSQESRVLEIERRERYELDRKQKLEQEKRIREAEAKFAMEKLKDAEKAKEDAISIVKTLESANKNLQKGCEALQDQVMEHQKRADRADTVSVKLREASYQQHLKAIGQQASEVAAKLAHDLGAIDNFDDLCEVLVTELLMEELGISNTKVDAEVVNKTSNNIENDKAKPRATFLKSELQQRGEVLAEEPAEEVESFDEVANGTNAKTDADKDVEEEYDDDDFDDEEDEDNTDKIKEATKIGKLPGNTNTSENGIFATRLHMEINKLREDLAKDVELRQTIAEERIRREGMEDRIKIMAEKEALFERAAKAEAELKQAAEREKYMEKLHLSMQQELSLQQKLEAAEVKAQFMELQIKKKEDEERALKKKLVLEGERADTFALAATRAVAQQPVVHSSVIMPPPTSEKKKSVIAEEDNSEKEDDEFKDDEEEEPRAYTILYARPDDDILYTKYGDSGEFHMDATENDEDSHYNSMLSDHSYANLTNASNYTSEDSSLLENTTEASVISGVDSLLEDSDVSNKIDESSASEIDIDALVGTGKGSYTHQYVNNCLRIESISATKKLEINKLISQVGPNLNLVGDL